MCLPLWWKYLDEKYKINHQEYFLDETAPIELKEKYYKPNAQTIKHPLLSNSDDSTITAYFRPILTFDEYLNYYQFLKGKYVERFKIDDIDCFKIKLIEIFGLDQAKQILLKLKNTNINLNKLLVLINDVPKQQICKLVTDFKSGSLLEQINNIDNLTKKMRL